MINLAHCFEPNARAFGRFSRNAAIAAASCMVLAVSPGFAKSLPAPPISVDGSAVSVPAVQRQNAVFVPVRGVFEKLGAAVDYTAPATIVARKGGQDLARMSVGSRAATVNGSPAKLSVAPFLAHGHVMVPLRLISEAAGATVAYAANPRSVQITHRVAAAAAPVAAPVASAAPVAEEHQGIPWWVWLLLALALLALIFFLMRRKPEPIIRTSSTGKNDEPKIETRR